MSEFQPTRHKTDLAEVVEMLLEKGIVINADIAVSIGDTQLLGIQVRAAIASFETAAKYGLEFPEGTDMRRVAEAVGDPELAEEDRPRVPIDPTRGVNVTAEGESREADGSGSEADGGSGSNDPTEDGTDLLEGERGGPEGSDFLGARPDPDRLTKGGMNLLSETTSDEALLEDESGSAETAGEEGSDAESESGGADESDANEDSDADEESDGDDESSERDDDQSGGDDGDD